MIWGSPVDVRVRVGALEFAAAFMIDPDKNDVFTVKVDVDGEGVTHFVGVGSAEEVRVLVREGRVSAVCKV